MKKGKLSPTAKADHYKAGMLEQQSKEVGEMRQKAIAVMFGGNKGAYEAHVATFPADANGNRERHEEHWLRATAGNQCSHEPSSEIDLHYEQLG